MSKEAFNSVMTGLNEALEYARGDKTKGRSRIREEYDFSQSRKNPYAKRLKKQITINLDSDTIEN